MPLRSVASDRRQTRPYETMQQRRDHRTGKRGRDPNETSRVAERTTDGNGVSPGFPTRRRFGVPRGVEDKRLKHIGKVRSNRPGSAAVPTKRLAKRPVAFGSLTACFCATRFAAGTVRSIATGVSWKTAALAAVARCSDMCCIWARSMTASARRGVIPADRTVDCPENASRAFSCLR
jgi:hypothetical protein